MCPATGLLKLSNHLSVVHGMDSSQRRQFLSMPRYHNQVGRGDPIDSSHFEDSDNDTGDTDTEDEGNLSSDTSFENSCSDHSDSDDAN